MDVNIVRERHPSTLLQWFSNFLGQASPLIKSEHHLVTNNVHSVQSIQYWAIKSLCKGNLAAVRASLVLIQFKHLIIGFIIDMMLKMTAEFGQKLTAFYPLPS